MRRPLFGTVRKRCRHTRVFANSLPKHNQNNMGLVELHCEKKRLASTMHEICETSENPTVPPCEFSLRLTGQNTARKMHEVRPGPVQSARPPTHMLQKRRTLILVRVALREKTPNPGESVQSGGSVQAMVGSSVTPTVVTILRKTEKCCMAHGVQTRMKKQPDAPNIRMFFTASCSGCYFLGGIL